MLFARIGYPKLVATKVFEGRDDERSELGNELILKNIWHSRVVYEDCSGVQREDGKND